MPNKTYQIGSCVFTLVSEEPIGDSCPFMKFLSDRREDITVRVRLCALPPVSGELLFRDAVRKVYVDGGRQYTYRSYFDSARGEYREFACRMTGGGKEELIIDYPDALWDRMIFEALDLPELLLRGKEVMLHSSFITVNGEGVIFAADKQVGKSTQAALWQQFAGAKIINGDRAVLGLRDGQLTAWGSPFCGTSGISENESAPVKAVILLSQGTKNTLSPLYPGEAFRNIIGKMTYNQWDLRSAENAADMAALIADGRVYHYSCRPDESAVRTLEKELCRN